MACDVLDLKCIFVNELVGSAFLATILFLILYFIIASKLKWGSDMVLFGLIPIMLLTGLLFGGFATIIAFSTFGVGLLIAWLFQVMIKN